MTISDAFKWLLGRRPKTADRGDCNSTIGQATVSSAFVALHHEAETLLARGENEAALAAFQHVIDRDESSAFGHLGQARAYFALERRQDAADSLEIALAIAPSDVGALTLLAKIRREAGSLDEALVLLRRARAAAPEDPTILSNLASVLNRCDSTLEAIEVYREAIQLAPHDSRAHINLGLIYLLQLGDAIRAEENFRSALNLAPDQMEASANLGLALHDQGRYDEELEIYQQALGRFPDNVELRWNRGIANLASGNYDDGWRDYELRFARSGRAHSMFAYPLWDGSSMPDGRLLVLGEQGLGDEVMFASCLPELGSMVRGVVVETAPRLAPLFARSFPQIVVHGCERHASVEWLSRYPDVAAKTLIGSLPMRLRRSSTDFPRHRGYLRADSESIERYRGQISSTDKRMAVGISWRGGTAASGGVLRSVNVRQLKALLSIDHVQFICLQHNANAEEVQVTQELGMLLPIREHSDIDDLAALICALDLVITVDNLNVHLAGALGCPAWGLLGLSPDWRWLNHGSSSPWYPSVVLFRAREFGGWEPMLDAIAERLQSTVLGADGGVPLRYERDHK